MDARTDTHAPDLLTIGLYTAPEAAELTGIEVQRIRRWLLGYRRGTAGKEIWSEPLWAPEVPRTARDVELSFRDLIELRFVAQFVRAGLSLHTIRRALAISREMTGVERPFSTARFRTDGRTVFLQVSREVEEPTLIDLLRSQYAFNRVVEPSFRNVDYDGEIPERWWPMSHRSNVVVDPRRNFGHPILASYGVPTRALADAIAAEGSIAKVARIYDLPMAAVRDAIAFERRAA